MGSTIINEDKNNTELVRKNIMINITDQKAKKDLMVMNKKSTEYRSNIMVDPGQPDTYKNLTSVIYEIPMQCMLVDEWVPEPKDLIFKHIDKAIILPVSKYYNLDYSTDLDYFIIAPKRCYNKEDMREHTTKYLNYFEKYYDKEHELLTIYYQMKYIIDYNSNYTLKNLINDLKKYILYNRSLLIKIYGMNKDNYLIELKAKKGRSVPSLQYNSKHGRILMQMSILMNMVLPLITHFVHKKKLDNIDNILLTVFDEILAMSTVDIYSKFYETATAEIKRNKSINGPLWQMQDIRGRNTTTHVMSSIENIILNIMPKYNYNQNIISFNFTSIRKNTGFKITDIKYEYNFTLLSSSNRDDDFNSDLDKYESYLVRQDESLFLQNLCNCNQTMESLEKIFGPFDPKEIEFYRSALESRGNGVINGFQKQLLFNLFYKYFGNSTSINSINSDGYVKLLLMARKLLLKSNMIILPYILSSFVVKIPNKKSINKKELLKITASPLWQLVQNKYKDPKIEDDILNTIGVILSSEFNFIDYHDEELNGKPIEIVSDIVIEECLVYILMI